MASLHVFFQRHPRRSLIDMLPIVFSDHTCWRTVAISAQKHCRANNECTMSKITTFYYSEKLNWKPLKFGRFRVLAVESTSCTLFAIYSAKSRHILLSKFRVDVLFGGFCGSEIRGLRQNSQFWKKNHKNISWTASDAEKSYRFAKFNGEIRNSVFCFSLISECATGFRCCRNAASSMTFTSRCLQTATARWPRDAVSGTNISSSLDKTPPNTWKTTFRRRANLFATWSSYR